MRENKINISIWVILRYGTFRFWLRQKVVSTISHHSLVYPTGSCYIPALNGIPLQCGASTVLAKSDQETPSGNPSLPRWQALLARCRV
jgi:hypothetical protein